jgi:hypothetical protein
MRRAARIGVAAAFLFAAAPAAADVNQLVVFRSGQAVQKLAKAAGTQARVGSRSCAVPADTALAALLRSKVGPVRLHDYGSCSAKPADAAGLYVRRIRRDAAHGASGWVYKVGNKVASAGAADPSGPFGNGRLKPSARITWFYCHMKATGCQRTLAITKVEPAGGGQVRVTVKAFDDRGKGKPSAGATVHAGTATAKTDKHGVATITASGGVFAERKGLVRSFEVK